VARIVDCARFFNPNGWARNSMVLAARGIQSRAPGFQSPDLRLFRRRIPPRLGASEV